jgi:membrane protease YdiL (CAAX protease family)
MDSVSAASQRRHLGVATVLAALVLGAFVLGTAWLHYSASRVEAVPDPERALALFVGRTLDLDDAIEGAPAWERRLYAVLLGGRADDLAQALRWYDELEARSLDPDVDLHAAILEGEAGRLERLRRRVRAWELRERPFPALASLIAAGYLDGGLAPDAPARAAAALPPGWFRDRLALRLAARAGDDARAATAHGELAARGGRLLGRLRGVALAEAAVFALGLGALAGLARRRGGRARPGSATFPPPWSGRAGAVVLVRGGALGAALMTALYLVPAGERPTLRLALATAANLAFVPVVLMARRRLLRPAGLDLRTGFGLLASRRDLARLAGTLLVLLALGQAGEWAFGFAARALDLSSHWTEGFDPDLAWGSRAVVAATLLDVVVLTPVLEELLFRGLLFATLRRGLGAPAAAVTSAGVFALAHGYGALGFASVFWSALLWAWAYERSGSLWPPIAAHAADNLSASLAMLLVLRG